MHAELYARSIISVQRAESIAALLRWQGGGCLLRPGVRPSVPGVTADEDKAIRDFWVTMPGYTSFYDAVLRLAKPLPARWIKNGQTWFSRDCSYHVFERFVGSEVEYVIGDKMGMPQATNTSLPHALLDAERYDREDAEYKQSL